MTELEVKASRRYTAAIGEGLLAHAGERIAPLLKGRRVLLVSDDAVFPLYGAAVTESLSRNGLAVESFVFPAGERFKTPETLLSIIGRLAALGLTKGDGVVALGGGVVTDTAGLAAALYRRGIPCFLLPTTLLAMADASVGGKTAVDLPEGKNLLGTVCQPRLVLCDTAALRTLPAPQVAAGWAEIIKCGMIRSRALLGSLETAEPGSDPEPFIAAAVGIKRDVVEADEWDGGERQLLNFGHTVGHAIELCSNYGCLHGHAVAMGMMIVTRACCERGDCAPECEARLRALLERYGLPVSCPRTAAELLQAASSDKKREGDGITLILPREWGRCERKPTDLNELKELLELGVRA